MGTITPNKGFTKPTVGGDVGLWGTETNGDWDLSDAALGGALSLSVAGSVDVTLTAAQSAFLQQTYTGAIGANINVIFPAAGGFWLIKNNTTGGFSLTVKTAALGSTGVVIPAGSFYFVASDATNMFFPTAPGQVATTTVTSSATLNLTSGQTYVGFNRTSALSAQAVNLPATPVDGQTHTLQDLVGNFNADPLTVTPPGGTTIAGLATFVCNRDLGTYTFRYYSTASKWGVAQA